MGRGHCEEPPLQQEAPKVRPTMMRIEKVAACVCEHGAVCSQGFRLGSDEMNNGGRGARESNGRWWRAGAPPHPTPDPRSPQTPLLFSVPQHCCVCRPVSQGTFGCGGNSCSRQISAPSLPEVPQSTISGPGPCRARSQPSQDRRTTGQGHRLYPAAANKE